MTVALAVALAFVGTLVGCGAWLGLARRWGVFDVPNHRSAHATPTPRGGGVGIFLGLFLAVGVLPLLGEPWPAPWLHWCGIAALLVSAGVIDDRHNLPVSVRLGLYALVSAAALWLLLPSAPAWLLVLALLYILWLTNLFNFMDGIDAIAAVEAGFALVAAAGLAMWQGAEGAFPLFCLLLAVSCFAFLHWNWPPARLFMGDAGSIPLGFLLAVLSIQSQLSGELPLVAWLVLLACFIADATYTLCWRVLHGERITEAHSRHLYQRLARHWRSHGRVVLAMLAYNIAWLLPIAVAATMLSGYWWIWLPLAYLPLLPALLKVGKLP